MKNIKLEKSLFVFILIPLTSFAFTVAGVYNSNGLPKVLVLGLGTFIACIAYSKRILITHKYQLVPILFLFSYVFSQFIIKNDLGSFLFGRFGRNGGIIVLCCLTVIFLICSNLGTESIKSYVNLFFITYYLLIVFGSLQIFDLLPFQYGLFELGSVIAARPDYGISLTFGNPNIAGAFLGIAISVQLILWNSKVYKNNWLQLLILLIACYLLVKTEAVQGFLVLLFNLALYIIYLSQEKLRQIWNIKFTIITFSLISFAVSSIYLSNAWNYLYKIGNIRERINYWKLSWDIWLDHKIFGIGIDNLAEYATFYRDLQLLKQEGTWRIPDRSHNVVLDHFVNGGFLTGFLWVLFIILVSGLAFKKIFNQNIQNLSPNFLIIISIWFGYLIQSLVSIDNIFLTLLGYISAGFIIGDHADHGTRAPIKVLRNVNYTRMIKPVVVLIFSVFSYYSISYVQFDRNANKFLSLNNATVLNNIYNSKIQDPKTLTDIIVKVGKDNQFEIAAKFSKSLLKLYPYSHQAYYAQSVYSESIKDIPQAVKYMRMAHDADKWNPTYLLGLSIYELNTGNYNLARAYLERVISIDPDQQGVKIVQERLTELSP